jgi:Ca2+-transporting ATPase
MILILGAAAGSLLFGLRTSEGSLLLPFTALQILWINFLGDGPPALAIALDSGKSMLLDPPRAPHAPLLDRLATKFIVADGLLKGGLGLLLLVVLPALGASFVQTATAVFLYEGVAKLLSMFPARRLHGQLRPNPWIVAASVVSVALQLGCVLLAPLRNVMGLVLLPTYYLLIVALALLTTLAFGEVTVRFLRPKLQQRDIALAA